MWEPEVLHICFVERGEGCMGQVTNDKVLSVPMKHLCLPSSEGTATVMLSEMVKLQTQKGEYG